jgi:hypothetical protein
VIYQLVLWIITTIMQAMPRRLVIQCIFSCISPSMSAGEIRSDLPGFPVSQ